MKNSALVICDMWDKHWSRGASVRVDLLAPKIDLFAKKIRSKGASIIHAPSNVVNYYRDSPARARILSLPSSNFNLELLDWRILFNPPLPIDDSDGGSDTEEPEEERKRIWTKQHEGIYIDQSKDVISDDGKEILYYFKENGIEKVYIAGVHTNKCILGRSFGIRQMKLWGVDIALIGDLTDSMYNPKRFPFVSHDEGTRLVIEYINKNWCPVFDSTVIVN